MELPDEAQLHTWGRKPRGRKIWLVHLPASLVVVEPDGTASDLSDDEIRAVFRLPENYLIVRHPEGTL